LNRRIIIIRGIEYQTGDYKNPYNKRHRSCNHEEHPELNELTHLTGQASLDH